MAIAKKAVKKAPKKAVKKAVKKPVKKAVKKAVKKPAKKAVKKAVKKPAKKVVKKAVKKPAKKVAKKPAKKAVKKPAKKPAAKKAAPKAEPAPSSGLAEGNLAPQFTLPATTGVDVNLNKFAGENAVVLYFYPKDDTPGCTLEAKDFQELKDLFARQGAVILGVSPDDMASHHSFCNRYSLTFPLLVDAGSKVAMAYGVWKEKSMYGRKFMGVQRTTFVIGKDGRVARVWSKVDVNGHAEEVLEYVTGLNEPKN
ncbi:MAG: peroxiredoxin [Myxococcales bacterium]|nr:MAG: peroxiredoxin [Myxococcales bacterium]